MPRTTGSSHCEVIIFEIGFEARVDRGDHGDAAPPRPADRAMGDDVGAGDVDDVGGEVGEVAPDAERHAQGQAIFGAPGDRACGHADHVADRLEGGFVDRRRIDPHLRALAQQIADEPVERLVGAVANIIVIAREQGDA